MEWAKTLVLGNDRIEQRLASLLRGLRELFGPLTGLVSDIDATGPIGNALLQRGIEEGSFPIQLDELIAMAEENGQVFDLEVQFEAASVEIIVVRGDSIDVLSSDDRLLPLLEPYEDLDPTWFTWLKEG